MLLLEGSPTPKVIQYCIWSDKTSELTFFAPILSYYLSTLYKKSFFQRNRCITFTLKNLKLKGQKSNNFLRIYFFYIFSNFVKKLKTVSNDPDKKIYIMPDILGKYFQYANIWLL